MNAFVRQTRCVGAAVAATLVIVLLASAPFATGVVAQTAPTAAPAPAPPSDTPFRPGLVHQLRDWWDQSRAWLGGGSKTTSTPAPANADAKSADAKPPEIKPADSRPAEAKPADVKAADTKAADTKPAAPGAGGEAATDASGPAAATGDALKSAVEATKGAAATATGVMKNAVDATKNATSAATDAMKGAMEATKDAASAIVRLPNTRIVDLHAVCARAPNGGSDCAGAATEGCRAKGFAGGNPLDVRTSDKCAPKPPQPGQMPGIKCAHETVVLRAVCQ